MKLHTFPGCCTAKILVGFGETDTAAYDIRPAEPYTDETMFAEILELLRAAGRGGNATVVATTNSDQRTANAVLPKAGFVCVQQNIHKVAHSHLQLSTWVYTVCDADRQALPLPVNPFVKKPKVEVPAPAQVQGMVDTLYRGVFYTYPAGISEEAFMGWVEGRQGINSRLRTAYPRDDTGRFAKMPKAGVWYTLEELKTFFIPDNMRYMRVSRNVDGELRKTAHSHSFFLPLGLDINHPANRAALGFIFA